MTDTTKVGGAPALPVPARRWLWVRVEKPQKPRALIPLVAPATVNARAWRAAKPLTSLAEACRWHASATIARSFAARHASPAVQRSILAFKDVDFGWKFCHIAAQHDIPMPPLFDAEDDVLWRAWLFCRDRERTARDDHFRQALSLTTPAHHHVRTTIKALLMAKNATPEIVGASTNIHPDVIRIFEKLFFNVLDRKRDVLYLQGILFPEGRGVKLNRDYLRQEDREKLLMRSAARNGPDDALYWACGSEDALQALAATKSTSQLENLMTGMGVLLARNGGLHQSGDTLPALSAARRIVETSKLSGDGDDGAMFDLLVGQSIRDEIRANQVPMHFREDRPQVHFRWR